MKTIIRSVGAGGKNDLRDAIVVQLLLNNHIVFDSELSKWLQPLVAHGRVKGHDPYDTTVTAITLFQREVMKLKGRRGLVEPDSPTLNALKGHIHSPFKAPPKRHAPSQFKIVLSPVQLASVLVEESISRDETLSNRLWGGAKMVGGVLELLGAGALAVAPEPTMVTKAGAVVLAAHGGDTLGTGARQLWTGEEEITNTERGTTALAEALGADPETAATIGVAVDIAVPIVVATVAGAMRVAAVRAGRISLAAEEAAGGHTIQKHVGLLESEMRARLAASSSLEAVSTFRYIEDAEWAISKALRANAAAIKRWAATAGPKPPLAWVHTFSEKVGYGLVRASGTVEDMYKVKVVLNTSTVSGKLYYVLTAYPCL